MNRQVSGLSAKTTRPRCGDVMLHTRSWWRLVRFPLRFVLRPVGVSREARDRVAAASDWAVHWIEDREVWAP